MSISRRRFDAYFRCCVVGQEVGALHAYDPRRPHEERTCRWKHVLRCYSAAWARSVTLVVHSLRREHGRIPLADALPTHRLHESSPTLIQTSVGRPTLRGSWSSGPTWPSPKRLHRATADCARSVAGTATARKTQAEEDEQEECEGGSAGLSSRARART